MVPNVFAGMLSRREWLRNAGFGAGLFILPRAATSGAVPGKDDTMQDIMHLIRIHAPSEHVYKAITTADGIRRWWTRDAAIEPKVGAAGEFGFNGRRFIAKVTVAELDPVARVRWKVTNSAWKASDIEFSLRAEGNDTTLLFAHRGFPRADDGLASATTRWGFYLLSLKRYMQTGKGTPNPDDSEGLG
jgi:uncharacterized protein YndB with AHSA1/START domain